MIARRSLLWSEARSLDFSRTPWIAAFILVFAAGCAADESGEDLIARGRELVDSGELSPSSLNLYRCTTCHDVRAGGTESWKPGAVLEGVTLRPSYWGGAENDLLYAIDDCRMSFMYAAAPLVPGDPDADALYAYLASLEPGASDAVAFTPVRDIEYLPRGDAARGELSYALACSGCHGAMHTGTGRRSLRMPVLPDDALDAHPEPTYSPRTQRLVFIEKTRHGMFLGYGGDMPPFSRETLSDANLSDVLEALGVVGE